MRQEFITAAREVIGMIPAGSAVAYSDVAFLLQQGGPRQIGALMSRHAEGLAWWRVLRASGEPPAGHELAAFEYYRREGTPLKGDVEDFARTGQGRWRVAFPQARWQPTEEDFEAIDAVADRLSEQLKG